MALSRNVEEIHMAVLLGLAQYKLVPNPEFLEPLSAYQHYGGGVRARSWFDIYDAY